MGKLTETLLLQLQQKVSNEMSRRKYGAAPLNGYSNNTFTESIKTGSQVKADTGKKTLDLLLKIKDIDGLSPDEYSSDRGVKIPLQFDDRLITLVDTLSTESITGQSSCRASCTGLCQTTCGSGCDGKCKGGCSGCSGGCSGDCESGCTGCGSACSTCGSCGSGCSGCGGGCSATSSGAGCTCSGCGSCGGYCGGGYSE